MKKLLLLLLPAFLCACNSNEPEKEIILQEIKSPNDCQSTVGWSWNDGVATAEGDNSSFEESSHKYSMVFQASANGELKFRYDSPSYKTYWIAVILNDELVFQQGGYNGDGGFYSSDVKKDQIVKIEGGNVRISNIRIVGTNDNSQPNNPGWDF